MVLFIFVSQVARSLNTTAEEKDLANAKKYIKRYVAPSQQVVHLLNNRWFDLNDISFFWYSKAYVIQIEPSIVQ